MWGQLTWPLTPLTSHHHVAVAKHSRVPFRVTLAKPQRHNLFDPKKPINTVLVDKIQKPGLNYLPSSAQQRRWNIQSGWVTAIGKSNKMRLFFSLTFLRARSNTLTFNSAFQNEPIDGLKVTTVAIQLRRLEVTMARLPRLSKKATSWAEPLFFSHDAASSICFTFIAPLLTHRREIWFIAPATTNKHHPSWSSCSEQVQPQRASFGAAG